MKILKLLVFRYKELVMYGIVGTMTTVINIAAFSFCRHSLRMRLVFANVAAWIIAFIFAFVANKLFVFESKSWDVTITIKELIGFLMARLATLFLDTLLMWVCVEVLIFHDVYSKIFINVFVIASNYLVSKFVVFKRIRD